MQGIGITKMGEGADWAFDQAMQEIMDDRYLEEQLDYEEEVEYWTNAPLEEVIATVRPYIDRKGVHECITGAVEDYVIFGTIGDFQKLCIARFLARLKR